MKQVLRFAFVFIVTLSLLGCSAATPEQGAKEWYMAVNEINAEKAVELVCEAELLAFQDEMAMSSAFFTLGSLIVGEQEVIVDLSKVKFETIQRDGDIAIVRATGEMVSSLGEMVNAEDLNETWIMKNEGGKWKWCGNN